MTASRPAIPPVLLLLLGKVADTGPTLAIYYQQKWRDRDVQPDMQLTPAQLVAHKRMNYS